jgi:hypothetical protein
MPLSHRSVLNPMNRSVLPDTERRIRGNERLIHEPFAFGVLARRHKPVGILALTGVEAEHLLVNVSVEVEGTRGDIRSVKRSLQARPKVFDSVGMDASFAVGHEVVNEAVRIVGQSTVGEQSVGIDRGARKNVGSDMGHKLRPLAPVNDHCLNPLLPRPLRSAMPNTSVLPSVGPCFILRKPRPVTIVAFFFPPTKVSSASTSPSNILSSVGAIASRIRCSMNHAVFCVTPRARPSSCDEVPFLVLARNQIAGNHLVNGICEDS